MTVTAGPGQEERGIPLTSRRSLQLPSTRALASARLATPDPPQLALPAPPAGGAAAAAAAAPGPRGPAWAGPAGLGDPGEGLGDLVRSAKSTATAATAAAAAALGPHLQRLGIPESFFEV